MIVDSKPMTGRKNAGEMS